MARARRGSARKGLFQIINEEDFGYRSRHTLKPGCKVSCSYAFYIGVSGVASFLSWKPGWEGDSLHAAACYAAEHDLMWKPWDLAGGNGNPDADRYFADPVVRRQMVPIIRQAREKDAQGVEYIMQALAQSPKL